MTVSTSINGTLRDCTAQGKGIGRLSEGDIAFVDAPDMTRRFAELLVAAKPAAVVNVARFTTGLIPNYGPHVLLDAGIPLYEAAGSSMRGVVKDGKKASVSPTGEVMMGKKLIGQASAVSREDVDATFADAQQALVDNMEAYFGNTIQFIHSEAPLLIDGVGSPELGDTMAERKVLVVSQSEDLRERLDGLKFFIREYTPVIIGVGAAADTLTKLGYDMDFIVGDPTDISNEALRGDAKVILPAETDGFAPGLERIQDLGVGAMTFPAATDSPTDLAILLAVFHDAEMVITVGQPVELDSIFADAATAEPAALLTRLKAGRKLVDSTVIEHLYDTNTGGGGVAWAWAILGLLVAAATVVLIVGLGGSETFTTNLVDTWNRIALEFQSWFN
ncbi:putative cytokinetic ring protein SteA [Corynebacterium riegelii]|uniref:putative cytokinetic ring protein SteA n=1 Tax=Corynebacterium riegelii TaxID=156976 RepID=UPI00191FE6F9|nr:putative cytokinetic ring protein SteA [Corynebacterium riegelii]MDK7179651.1 putative cytokinetic ring protein SteA [Corynebacterium riegelii]QQU83519.1 thiamine pyrophosphokinase [Corynebacterium riegelii]